MDKKSSLEKSKLPITLCIITHNSEKRIKSMVLKHKKLFSEVMIVVQKSTDNTLARAREVADVVIERRCKGLPEFDKNWLFDLARNKWILHLDDDEFLGEKLVKNLGNLIKENADIFWFKRTNYVDGIDIFDILGHDMQPRLFKKGSLDFPKKAHVYPIPKENTKTAFVEHDIIHERTLAQVENGNRIRNGAISKETVKMQEEFINNVRILLKERG